jgi:probable addiction module antidote protein
MDSNKQEMVAAKLDEALESHDIKKFMAELAYAIREQGGYTAAAVATGINRTSLYKIVSEEGNPTANTLLSILGHLGLRLSVEPLDNVGQRPAVPPKPATH